MSHDKIMSEVSTVSSNVVPSHSDTQTRQRDEIVGVCADKRSGAHLWSCLTYIRDLLPPGSICRAELPIPPAPEVCDCAMIDLSHSHTLKRLKSDVAGPYWLRNSSVNL